ncbi:MAG TPA: hypothetical protein VJX10_05020 [Pseudonocardiaceae bacterium]|nr:hypothetical protein [Pseudonocardiaceae bacterium]
MGASSYNAADIGQARQAIGAEAGKFGSVGDAVPDSVAAGMFGTLPNSAAVAQAAAALCSSVRREYAKAESLVGAIERALDQNLTHNADTEQNNKRSFTTERV